MKVMEDQYLDNFSKEITLDLSEKMLDHIQQGIIHQIMFVMNVTVSL